MYTSANFCEKKQLQDASLFNKNHLDNVFCQSVRTGPPIYFNVRLFMFNINMYDYTSQTSCSELFVLGLIEDLPCLVLGWVLPLCEDGWGIKLKPY